jgi:NAD(P)-dependent dehydrogenase (short-subunit alcohol dehydrogenase family)
MHLKPIDQQVVVIVGASSGIGRATARRFAKRGAKLVVSARSQPGLASLVAEIQGEGGAVTAIPADVAEFAPVNAIAERAIEAYGRLDTWVHLAAVSVYAPFEQTTPEEFRRVIDVNLLGQVHGAMAALPHLRREGRGALIHVSSVEARRALPLQSAYAASKHGIEGFLEALRLELQHEGVPISVTNILPASINTPFFNKARTKLGVKPAGMPPIYQPSLVAESILYAAEHPTRDLIVGGAGQTILLLQRLSPRLADAYLRRTSFARQRTQEPKAADAPDNLFQPLPGEERIEGDFHDQTHTRSVYTWFARHPGVKRALAGVVAGAVALLAAHALRKEDGGAPRW